MKESRKLLSRTMGSCIVRSVTQNTVTIDEDGIAIPVSLDRVPGTLGVPTEAEPTAGLLRDMGQSKSGMEKAGEESGPFSAEPNVQMPVEYALDRGLRHRGARSQTEYRF